MPRRPGYHWDRKEQAYRTDARGRTKYFRGIARDDLVGIAGAFSAYLAELEAGERPAEPTVEDLCVAFVRAGRGVRERTAATHKERLLRFCAYPEEGHPEMIGARTARSLRARDLREALRAWEAAGLSGHYRAGICRSVKAAFAWAATEEAGHLIPSNPLAEVRGPAVARSPERYTPRREIAAFLRFAWRRAGYSAEVLARHRAWLEAQGRDGELPPASYGDLYRRFGRLLVLMIRVAARNGARPGELCSAWWCDLDPARGTITLPPARHKTGRKTGRPRVLYLGPILARALARESRRAGRHPVCVFTHKRGKGGVGRGADRQAGEPWGRFLREPDGSEGFESDSTALAKAIRSIRKEAVRESARRRERIDAGDPKARMWGLDLVRDEGENRLVLYQLRHTKASDDLMNGGNQSDVAGLLGTSPRMLETTYGHLLDDHMARAAEDLEARRRAAARQRPAGEGPGGVTPP